MCWVGFGDAPPEALLHLGVSSRFLPNPPWDEDRAPDAAGSQLSRTQDIGDDSFLYLLSSMVLQSSGKGTPLTFLTLRSTEHPNHPAAAVPLGEHVHLQN